MPEGSINSSMNDRGLTSEPETDYKDVLALGAVVIMYLVVPLLMLIALFLVAYGTFSLWIHFRRDSVVIIRVMILYAIGAAMMITAVKLSRWLRR